MTVQKTRVGHPDQASQITVEPVGNVTKTNVQTALEQLTGLVTPNDAEFLVGTAEAALPNARIPTATATISWDFATANQAKANIADAELLAIAGLTSAADKLPYFTGSGTAALADFSAAARSVLDDASTAAMLTTLGAQPVDAELTALAGTTSAADALPYFTGSGTATTTTLTAAARTVLDDASTAAMLTTLGGQPADATLTALAAYNTNGLLAQTAFDTFTGRTITAPAAGITISNPDGVAGNPTLALADDLAALEALSGTSTIYYRSGTSAWSAVTIGSLLSFSGGTLNIADAELSALAGLTSAADSAPYFTGSGTAALMTVTSTARSILDDASTSAIRTTLGVGTGDSPTFAAVTVGNAGLTVGASVPFSDSAGTLTLQNVDALDATTESTIEAAIDTLANLTSIQGRTVTLADAGADRIFGWDDSADAYVNLSAADATAVLNVMVGDSGSGGTKGLVPAPVAGDAVKFFRGDGTFQSIPGGGDALVANPLSQFAATTSLQLKGVISDETGSGALVFGTNPVIQVQDSDLSIVDNSDNTKVLKFELSGITTATTRTITVPNTSDTMVTLAAAQALSNKTITYAAGSTSVAPITLTSGTNLTTAAAGNVEYDGKVAYLTPQGTQRGAISTPQIFRLDSALVGSNATGNQALFGKSVTLSGSTVYAFEIVFTLVKSAGTTSHTISFGFLGGGSGTVNNILAQSFHNSAAGGSGTVVAVSRITFVVATVTGLTAAITTASTTHSFLIKGTVSVNAGGTFEPVYALSAAPGGAYSTQAGSYMAIWPIGASGADVNVGTWA